MILQMEAFQYSRRIQCVLNETFLTKLLSDVCGSWEITPNESIRHRLMASTKMHDKSHSTIVPFKCYVERQAKLLHNIWQNEHVWYRIVFANYRYWILFDL